MALFNADELAQMGEAIEEQTAGTEDEPQPGRERRGSLQALDHLQKLAAQNAKLAAETKPADLGTALQASLIFAASMIGEAVFVLLRDSLDTTKQREKPQSAEEKVLEQALAAEAVANLEAEHRQNKLADKHWPDITEKQKTKRAQSARKLTRARSVRDVVTGLREVGRVDDAESLAKKILSARQSMYGSQHVATAHAVNQLGAILAHKGKLSDAMLQFQKCLDATRAALGSNSLCEATLLINMAHVAMAQSQVPAAHDFQQVLYEEASRLGLLAADIYALRYGASHELTVKTKRAWQLTF